MKMLRALNAAAYILMASSLMWMCCLEVDGMDPITMFLACYLPALIVLCISIWYIHYYQGVMEMEERIRQRRIRRGARRID